MGYREPTFEFPSLNGETKLRELILHVADQCADDPTFGAIKLNKILFAADMESYLRFGTPITGLKYQAIQQGPAAVRMLPILQDMEEKGDAKTQRKRYYTREQKRVFPLRDPDFNGAGLTADDIAIVDGYIGEFWGLTAKEISERFHNIQYDIAGEGGLIPYEAAFISNEPLTEDDITRADQLIAEHGWNAEDYS